MRAHDVALCLLPVKRDDAALGQAGIGPRLAELPPETPDKCALRNSTVVAHIYLDVTNESALEAGAHHHLFACHLHRIHQ